MKKYRNPIIYAHLSVRTVAERKKSDIECPWAVQCIGKVANTTGIANDKWMPIGFGVAVHIRPVSDALK